MKKVVASWPRPPFVDSTRGVKTSWAQPRALVHHTRLVHGDGRLAHGMIGECVWMKNPYVKECIL